MAKITPLEPVKNITGTLKLRGKKFTFSTRFDGDAQYMRHHTVPSYATTAMLLQRQKYAAVTALYPAVPTGFKQALSQYAQMWNKQHRKSGHGGICGYNVFIMALCQTQVPLMALNDVNDVATLFGATVKEWIDNGLLARVDGVLSNAQIV